MAGWPNLLTPMGGVKVLITGGIETIGIGNLSSAPGAAWPSANRAIFIPLRITEPVLVVDAFCINNLPSGNVDLGIYSLDGTRIVSTGSTANSGSTTTQTIALTDTLLSPGAYYMAMAADNATTSIIRSAPNLHVIRCWGTAKMDSAFPLPASATLAASTDNYVPWFGFVLGAIT